MSMKKQLLKFDSALGYYKGRQGAIKLSDGRYALDNEHESDIRNIEEFISTNNSKMDLSEL